MLKIRLKRVGRKHDPSYRVVLIESGRGPKSGKINEILGFYDPRKDVKELKAERIQDWISKGAQVSDTVHNILVGEKIISGKKINVLPKKSPIKSEDEKGQKVENEEKVQADVEVKTETPEKVTETKEEIKTEELKEIPESPKGEEESEIQTKPDEKKAEQSNV